MSTQPPRAGPGHPSRHRPVGDSAFWLLRKILFTGVLGLLAFVGSNLLDKTAQISTADQLVLTAIVGGCTWISQYLAEVHQRLGEVSNEVHRRLAEVELEQKGNLREVRTVIDEGFARINDATKLFRALETSALRTDALTQLVDRSSRIADTCSPLVRDLAHHELERLSALLKSLGDGNEAFYDGEDREWLLGLAANARTSVSATSLATVDAGGRGFEGGLWLNDLGGRYLELQRAAAQRGVRIRRIFVFDDEMFSRDFIEDSNFVRIRQLQRDAQIEVRVLKNKLVPERLKSVISDFIVFDDTVSYEMTPFTRMEKGLKPSILTTRLVLDPERVNRAKTRFEELWKHAGEVES